MKHGEINKIISEFMGYYFTSYDSELKECYGFLKNESPENEDIIPCYTESLDALVPVWKKLNMYRMVFEYECYDNIGWFTDLGDFTDIRESHDDISFTLQESAAYSTAKVIKKLND